nr:hypothetical protein [Tanacetum cinerariifolium]
MMGLTLLPLPKLLRRDHADRPSGSSHGGKSLAAMQLCMAFNVFVSEGAPADVSDPDPLSFADALSHHPVNVAQSSQSVAAAGDPKSENVSSPAEVGSSGSVYRPEWGVTNGSLLDTPEACQDLVDHAALRMARRDQRIQAQESEIKNLEALLETEAGMKRDAEEKSVGLSQELERMRAQFSELQAAFENYKRQQDQMVEQRCAEMDARLDVLSIDFDEELYPHMLTAIAGRMPDGVPVSVPTVVPQGLAILLVDAATQTDFEDA